MFRFTVLFYYLLGPKEVTARVLSNTDIRLTFTPADGAEPIAYYAVAVRHIPNKCQVKATAADPACNVTGLQAETTYEMAGMVCLEEGSACGGVFLLSTTTAPHREFIYGNNNLN